MVVITIITAIVTFVFGFVVGFAVNSKSYDNMTPTKRQIGFVCQ